MATLRGTTVYESVGLIDTLNSPPSIAAPSGLAAGDLLLVPTFFAQGIATAGEGYVPNGMVKITGTPEPTTGDTRRGVIYAAVVEDPADFAGGISLRSPATATRVAAVALAWEPDEGKEFRLEDLVVPTGTWQVTNLPGFDYPTGATGDFVLGIAMTNKSASTTYTEHTSVGGTMLAQAQALNGASGSVSDSVTSVAEGGTGVTFNINQANGIAFAVGVTEANTDDPPVPLPDVTGHGFVSVQQMLETPGATWAHRNLGGTYPEMTEYGARMAANHGHGVIEVSCLRTSDGVWVGTHDATPDRVALETTYDGQFIESLTASQVLSLHAVVGPTGAPQPFARAIDIFQTLPEDFVFLVDPKSSAANHMADFLNMLDTYLGPERAIVKIDGAATLPRFQAAKAAGYLVAAYFYSNTPEQTIADRMPYVDIPGMNWDAGQGSWDLLLGYDKPVWGHVCQTQEQYNTCISKGATFVQCTTTAITPVGVESWVPPEDAPPVYLGDTPLRGIMLGETKVIGAYLGETPLWGGDFPV